MLFERNSNCLELKSEVPRKELTRDLLHVGRPAIASTHAIKELCSSQLRHVAS